MTRLSTKKFVFITGVEGSGTTMLLKLLSKVNGFVALGGNYCTPGWNKQSAKLNMYTQQLWRYPHQRSLYTKMLLLSKIRRLPLSQQISCVVYKRSYPFIDQQHYPLLKDIMKFSNCVKLIVIHRNLSENANSIRRRGFEPDIERARQRAKKGNAILNTQLEKWSGEIQISYENLIAKQKEQLLHKLELFLDLPNNSLKNHRDFITGPTP